MAITFPPTDQSPWTNPDTGEVFIWDATQGSWKRKEDELIDLTQAIINLEEEIEVVAPSHVRGIYDFTTNDPPGPGEFTCNALRYENVTEVLINQTDALGIDHSLYSVEVEDHIEIFDTQDVYGLEAIVDDIVEVGIEFIRLKVSVVRAIDPVDNSDIIGGRVQIKCLETLDNKVDKKGDTMSGRLVLPEEKLGGGMLTTANGGGWSWRSQGDGDGWNSDVAYNTLLRTPTGTIIITGGNHYTSENVSSPVKVWRSTDNLDTIQEVYSGNANKATGRAAIEYTSSTAVGFRIILCNGRKNFVKSNDDGVTWNYVTPTLPDQYAKIGNHAPKYSDRLYSNHASTGPMGLVNGNSQYNYSNMWAEGGKLLGGAYSANTRTLVITFSNGRILRRKEGNQNLWSRKIPFGNDLSIHTGTIGLLNGVETFVIAGSTANKIAISTNDGDNWEIKNSPMSHHHASGYHQDVGFYFSSPNGNVSYSTFDFETWTPIGSGVGDIDIIYIPENQTFAVCGDSTRLKIAEKTTARFNLLWEDDPLIVQQVLKDTVAASNNFDEFKSQIASLGD